jgi:hypothetical protein
MDAELLRKTDCMTSILSVIATALECDTAPAAICLLLNTIRTSTFLSQYLGLYFTNMQMGHTSAAKQRSFRQAIKNSLLLYRQLLHRFPDSLPIVQLSLNTLDYVANDLRMDTNIIDDETDDSLSETKKLRDEVMEKQRAARKDQERFGGEPGVGVGHRRRPVEQPPNDFREMSIFPSVQMDFQATNKPFLRENIVEGAFEDVEHYLDVQFRLLREDFVQPLRKGIREYLDIHAAGGADDRRQLKRLSDIRIYHDVCVLNPICAQGGIQYRIRFDSARTAHVKWKFSKRLIFGSLLCLSSDDFATIYIATVSQRDAKLLADGELIIQFEADLDAVQHILPTERFLMFETSAYFEAYRHVLTALQASRDVDVPFSENIILCHSDVKIPQYLRLAEEPQYDLRAIAGQKTKASNSGQDDDEEMVKFVGRIRLSGVEILRPAQWPSPQTLHLDESQLRAIQMALTKRVAIIQGPPGTGKTYIGLKIVQVLLENAHIWNGNTPEDHSPILVVCYTNHALDQFLEGLCPFVKNGIVRVGGRSKSQRLEQFLLRELRKKTRESRDVPRRIFLNRQDARLEMELQQVEIERQTAMIVGTERGLIHERILQEFMM